MTDALVSDEFLTSRGLNRDEAARGLGITRRLFDKVIPDYRYLAQSIDKRLGKALPPHLFINRLFEIIGMPDEHRARFLDLSSEAFKDFLSGKIPVSPKMAERLDIQFGQTQSYWTQTEHTYHSQHMLLAAYQADAGFYDYLQLPLSECRKLPYSHFEEARQELLNKLFFITESRAYDFKDATVAEKDIQGTCTALRKNFFADAHAF